MTEAEYERLMMDLAPRLVGHLFVHPVAQELAIKFVFHMRQCRRCLGADVPGDFCERGLKFWEALP